MKAVFTPFHSLKRSSILLVAAWAIFSAAATPLRAVAIKADNSNLFFSGRFLREGDKQVTQGWSGDRVGLRFTGTSVVLQMTSDTRDNFVLAWVDGKPGEKIRLDSPGGVYPVAAGLRPGEHTVEIVRLTECFLGQTHFLGFVLDDTGTALPWPSLPNRRVLFIGDSITCGYGVEVNDPKEDFKPATENFCESYTGLTVRALQADYIVVARSGIGMVRNYGGPFEGNADAMPAVYPYLFYQGEKTPWNPAQFIPQVICLNLGTNDFSGKGVNQEKFVATYIDFASRLAAEYPQARLVLLQGPMENGEALAHALKRVQDSLTKKYPGRIEFFTLSHQGEVGFGASYHPNREQSRRNAAELTTYLAKLMEWR